MNRALSSGLVPWFLYTLLLCGVPASAAPEWSARRGEAEDWRAAAKRVLGTKGLQDGTAYSRAVPLQQLDRSAAAEFPGAATDFQQSFREIRDRRFLDDPAREGFTRRATWLYPDDGCYQRAGWMSRMLNARFGRTWANRLFAFGDLKVQTRNHPQGAVYWWYHVVVATRFEGEVRIFDPAIDPSAPMSLDSWVGRMSDEPGQVKVSICKAGAYGPSSPCDRAADVAESELRADTRDFLGYERDRLKELGRNADRELGDHPPW